MDDSDVRFQAITHQSSEGICLADMEGSYTFVNPAFCKMIGYSESELLRMTVFDVKAEHQDPGTFKKSKTTAEGTPIQVALKRKDGTEFISEIVGTVINISGDDCVLGTVRDITERVQASEALQAKHDQLEKALAEIKQLSGLLPICANCKKIRDNAGEWQHLEIYIRDRSEAEFSHSICPGCAQVLYPDDYEE